MVGGGGVCGGGNSAAAVAQVLLQARAGAATQGLLLPAGRPTCRPSTSPSHLGCCCSHANPPPPSHLAQLSGEKYALLAVVEALSHVLREHPIMERPGGPPPALRGQAPAPGSAAAPPPVAAGIPGYAPGGFRRY